MGQPSHPKLIANSMGNIHRSTSHYHCTDQRPFGNTQRLHLSTNNSLTNEPEGRATDLISWPFHLPTAQPCKYATVRQKLCKVETARIGCRFGFVERAFYRNHLSRTQSRSIQQFDGYIYLSRYDRRIGRGRRLVWIGTWSNDLVVRLVCNESCRDGV